MNWILTYAKRPVDDDVVYGSMWRPRVWPMDGSGPHRIRRGLLPDRNPLFGSVYSRKYGPTPSPRPPHKGPTRGGNPLLGSWSTAESRKCNPSRRLRHCHTISGPLRSPPIGGTGAGCWYTIRLPSQTSNVSQSARFSANSSLDRSMASWSDLPRTSLDATIWPCLMNKHHITRAPRSPWRKLPRRRAIGDATNCPRGQFWLKRSAS